MKIRPIEVEDAESFIELSKKIDESGFMMLEPGERQTTVEQQTRSIERISKDEKSIFYVADVDGILDSDKDGYRYSEILRIEVFDISVKYVIFLLRLSKLT